MSWEALGKKFEKHLPLKVEGERINKENLD
jgi:hypothetical protein